jgi:D-alanyl-D-alanine dipeptidase
MYFVGSAQPDLKIMRDPETLLTSIKKDPKLALKELKTVVPGIKYDLKYATPDNFTGVRLYPAKTENTYLRIEPALALSKAAEELRTMGLGIWVWDALRPYHVTVRFWELIKDERYVAHPSKGSGHNRGIAIDLTLYKLETGELLDMPTLFDDFSEKAHHGYNAITDTQKNNRELLRTIMEKNGFIKFQTEWWHFYWPNGEQYDVLDFSFKQLKKITRDTTQ